MDPAVSLSWLGYTLALLACVPSLALALALCLKIKSSRKDPAIMGTEGTIYRINADTEQQKEVKPKPSNGSVTQLTTPPSAKPSSRPSPSARTPSRAGERKLPDIPKEDTNSNLYDTLDRDSDSEDEDTANKQTGAKTTLEMDANGVGAHHPYAKVKKSKMQMEHPYATVKKPAQAQNSSNPSEGGGAQEPPITPEDDEAAQLLRPQGGAQADPLNRSSRTGSGRSSHHLGEDLSTSMHSVVSRQATPLPPEPIHNNNNPGPPQVQSPNIHFSGDSQDSSKGYTSITVREPVRHIQLPSRPIDATYATVSETSDDMYAAIDDPSYIPTGNSQSNSDTYAVIDLPEEPSVVDGGQGAVSMNPGPGSMGAIRGSVQDDMYHAYSKVDKRKKKAAPAADIPPVTNPGGIPPLPLGKRPQRYSTGGLASKLDEMYAKVNKRGSVEPEFEDPDLEMPIGASANQAELGARPKQQQQQQGGQQQQQQSAKTSSGSSIKLPLGRKSALKADINYSDYEVSHYDKGKMKRTKALAVQEPGYETVPEPKREGSEPGYETVPGESWKKYELTGGDGGYETVPAERNTGGGGGGGGYERVPGEDPEYWRSNNSAGYETVTGGHPARDRMSNQQGSGGGRDPGYETVTGPRDRAQQSSGGRDPGYETVTGPRDRTQQNSGGRDPGYEVVRSNSWRKDPGYESVPSRRSDNKRLGEPSYAKLTHDMPSDGSEVGYETIPGPKRAENYDPGYEVLPSEKANESGYEVVRQDGRFRGPLPPPEATLSGRPPRALPGGDDRTPPSADPKTEVNTHIYV